MNEIAFLDTKKNLAQVRKYYNDTQKWYSLFYIDKESLGIHYGFWKNDTQKRSDALINQYREIARLLELKEQDKVLDGGCGVGGACFWLAENFKVDVTGITISEKQLEKARKLLYLKHLQGKVMFYLMDFFNTTFANESFDKIFGIESFCYSYPKPQRLYREMYRILKRGGKIAISDGVILRQPQTKKERLLLNNFQQGYALEGMCTPYEIILALSQVGFKNIKATNFTKQIARSVREIYTIGIMTLPLYLLKILRLASSFESGNYQALFSQKKMYDLGLFGYYTFVADK
jgi:cyclopropane fatty-acyl-phospholipid synthase-like methyltransferase